MKTLKGLLVAAVPATLGILFGIGVIMYGLNHNSQEAAAKPGETKEAAGDMKGFVKNNCSGCHGGDLKGGVGPSLVGTALSEEQIADILKNGRNAMPKGLAAGKEAEVAKYLKTLK